MYWATFAPPEVTTLIVVRLFSSPVSGGTVAGWNFASPLASRTMLSITAVVEVRQSSDLVVSWIWVGPLAGAPAAVAPFTSTRSERLPGTLAYWNTPCVPGEAVVGLSTTARSVPTCAAGGTPPPPPPPPPPARAKGAVRTPAAATAAMAGPRSFFAVEGFMGATVKVAPLRNLWRPPDPLEPLGAVLTTPCRRAATGVLRRVGWFPADTCPRTPARP